jgi:hypothetical protein
LLFAVLLQFLTIGALGKGSHTIDFSVTTDNDGLADNDKSILVAFNDSGELNTVNGFESDDTALVAYNSSGDGNLWERTPLVSRTISNNF